MSEYKSTSRNGKSVLQHRLIWENFYGKIPKGMIIHHINEDKKDNRIENLICISKSEHTKLHLKQLK